jgi:hypothetical protein
MGLLRFPVGLSLKTVLHTLSPDLSWDFFARKFLGVSCEKVADA